MGKGAVVGWGVVLGAFACGCAALARAGSADGATIIEFVLGAMTFAYAGLLGVFLTALVTRRGTERSAIAALVVGFAAVAAMQPRVWGMVETPWAARIAEGLSFAFPWRLTIAAGLSTLVCAWPRGRGGRERYTPGDA